MEPNTATPQTPVPVQVVQGADPESVAHDKFAEKLARMERAPTMQPGDRERRPSPNTQPQAQPAQQPEQQEATQPEAAAEQTAAEELYEFEFGSGRYQVPKELKELHDGYLRQQDYTQKQQEIAEIRRSAEAALQQSRAQQELHTALAPHYNQLNAINQRLSEYSKVDWNALWASDQVSAQQHSMQFSVLNNQKQVLERQLQQTAQEHMKKITDAEKSAMEAADKAMSLKVKGWTHDTGKALKDFARNTYGFTENEANTLDPRALEMMHDARKWRDLQASKSSKVVQPEKTLKPAGAQPATSTQERVSELRKGFRTAKTDGERERIAEKIFATKIR